MSNDKNAEDISRENTSQENDNKSNNEPLSFHNPLKPEDSKQITQEDIENEQKYKEALSERD